MLQFFVENFTSQISFKKCWYIGNKMCTLVMFHNQFSGKITKFIGSSLKKDIRVCLLFFFQNYLQNHYISQKSYILFTFSLNFKANSSHYNHHKLSLTAVINVH